MLAAIACDEYARAGVRAGIYRAWTYLRVVLASFFLVNLPFIVIDPEAWIRGTLTPLVKDMVPSGQGTVALSLFLHIGGGSLFAFTVATVMVLILVLVAYVGTYPLVRPATFILPALVYFFASRSQTNYLIALIPVAIVGAVTIGPPPRVVTNTADAGDLLETSLTAHGWRAWFARQIGPTGPIRSLRWAQVIGLVAVITAGSVIYSMSATPPLKMTIEHINLDGFQGLVQRLVVRVTNTSGKRVTPHFTVQDPHGFTTFWLPEHGPKYLNPGESENYVLAAGNTGAEPAIGGGFSVIAFLNDPGSVSVSNRYLPELQHLVFNPQAFNDPIPVGKTEVVQVQLVGHTNQTVDTPGVAVYLNQVMDSGTTHDRTSAIINGHLPGSSNVVAYTNAQGIATFNITGTRGGILPTQFIANLKDNHASYIYGQTGRLLMRFVGSGK